MLHKMESNAFPSGILALPGYVLMIRRHSNGGSDQFSIYTTTKLLTWSLVLTFSKHLRIKFVLFAQY